MSQKLDISIVIPVFNAESTLVELNHQIVSFMNQKEYSFEIIYVDDRSTDNSWEILNELQKNNPEQVKIIRFTKNFGQHEATMCGMLHVNGNLIVTMDDDLENQVSDIDALIQKWDETKSKVIYGVYSDNRPKGIRKILTKIFHFVSKAEGSSSKVKGSSFRLIDFSLVEQLKNHKYSFIWLDEIFLWYASQPEYVTLKVNPNIIREKSRYSLLRLIKLAVDVVLYSSTIPLKLLTSFGFGLAVLNFAIGLYYIFKKIFFNVQLGYTSIIVSILFTSGIILMGIGILGIYVSRITSIVNKEPHYSIDEKKC